MRGRLAALGASAAVALAAPVARGERAVGGGLHAVGGATSGSLAVSSSHAPPLLTSPRLDGSGSLRGFEVRIFAWSSPWRVGLADGLIWESEGRSLRFDPLPQEYSVSTRARWGGHFELFVGYQRRFGPVYPFLDWRVGGSLWLATADLSSETHGFVGSTAYRAGTFLFGPRLGVLVPMTRHVYLDMAAHGSLFGPERYGGTAGLGVWLR